MVPKICGDLSALGLMSIQRIATFQAYGIKPSFSDMVKARAKSLQNPVPYHCTCSPRDITPNGT